MKQNQAALRLTFSYYLHHNYALWKNIKLKFKKCIEWDLNYQPDAYGLMAAHLLCTPVNEWLGLQICKNINLVFFKDTAFISSKSRFDRCTHYWVISIPKVQTDGQTDRQMAFQLYIVDWSFLLACIVTFGHFHHCYHSNSLQAISNSYVAIAIDYKCIYLMYFKLLLVNYSTVTKDSLFSVANFNK